MSKVYFVRHQAAGIMHEFPFSEPPTDAQMSAVSKLCFQRFGATHPKNDAAYWTRIEERELLGARDVPEVPEHGLSVVSTAGAAEFKAEAFGTVTPKDEV